VTPDPGRETFASRFGLLASMIGVAVGLGNMWRFPYMAGEFGGAPFVLVYLAAAVGVGVPALMAEWTLGRHTGRGPVGAFEKARLPLGRTAGWIFFGGVAAATGYYTNAVGWVLMHAVGSVGARVGLLSDPGAILPPDSGFDPTSFFLQAGLTAIVILACVAVLLKGLRRGIERASRVVVPLLLVFLVVLIARALTLPGAAEGVQWYLFKLEPGALRGSVVLAALGQAIFSLSLGGTYMVVYGSYLAPGEDLRRNAIWTAAGDVGAGLLAGFAIFPAVFALGLEPASGPALIFATLPQVFAGIPLGWAFGGLFFLALFGAAYLSDVAAFEVLVAGLTDNTELGRRRAVWISAALVFLLALPPMLNMEVFVPWDLAFGSGLQTVGALLTVVTVGWSLRRAEVLRELTPAEGAPPPTRLYLWLRYGVPAGIGAVGVWWLYTEVLPILLT